MTSADDNPTVVDEYLAKEVVLGRVVGPVNCESGPQLPVNRFGVIPLELSFHRMTPPNLL